MEKLPSPQRIAAVDIFRALTMFFMLFVNDIPGLKNVPHWLMHAEMTEDMLGFSDTIFPAFLFCMGMSVSFAIQNRYRKGDTTLQVISHVVSRTVALVVMGLFTLNSGGVEGGLSHQCFTLLMVLGFFLTWGVYPRAEGARKNLFSAMKVAGALLLIGLVLYKDMHGASFRTGWWGILGLIGWTYIVCTFIYLYTRESVKKNFIAWVLTLVLVLFLTSDFIPQGYYIRNLFLQFVPGGWSHHALGMSGVLASVLMQHYVAKGDTRRLLTVLCGLGAAMLVCGLLAHPHWIVSKILATPTWIFYCLAIYFPLFGFFYWLTDVKGKAHWFALLKPAGTATLTCYIVPYIWYAVQQLLGWHYPAFLRSGVPGLLKSLLFSLIIVLLTGLLVKAKIKLKV